MSNNQVPTYKRQGTPERAEGYKRISLEAYGRLLKLRRTMTQSGSPGVNIVQSTEELDMLLAYMRGQLGPEADVFVQGQNRR